jgi:hypothetical protein
MEGMDRNLIVWLLLNGESDETLQLLRSRSEQNYLNLLGGGFYSFLASWHVRDDKEVLGDIRIYKDIFKAVP